MRNGLFSRRLFSAIRGRGGRPASSRRRVPDGVFRIARTRAQWRDLPEEFGKRSSVYRRFRRRTPAGLWELIPGSLNDGGAAPRARMIDGTVIRAHHPAAGAKGGLTKKVSAVQKVASRPGYIRSRMPGVYARADRRRLGFRLLKGLTC